MKKKYLLLTIAAAMFLAIAACGKNAGQSDVTGTPVPTEPIGENGGQEELTVPAPENSPTPESPERDVVLNEDSVKLLGRTQQLLDKNLLCALSGSGVAFSYTGKKLEVEFVGDNNAKEGNEDNCARIAIYVNDELTQDFMLTKKKMPVMVWQGEDTQTIQVRIVKLSESAQSIFAIKPIHLAAGESISPAESKAHRIEFIGDSITCGYGVDDPVASHHFSTKTEDVTKAYAYQAAQMLDADYSMFSISGYGIISGYTADPNVKSSQQLIPDYYNKLGNSYGRLGMSIQPQSLVWSFDRFVPEVVVINLGTNDASYCKNDAVKVEEYVEGYVAFLKQVREYNPGAEILCTLGLMGQDLCAAMERACDSYIAQTGDAHVHSLRLAVQDSSLGIAADWHPTEANHRKAAETLAAEIRRIMGW